MEQIIDVPTELEPRAIAALHRAITAGVDDAATRVIVLRGADGIFCRGMSLDELVAADDPSETVRAFAQCLKALRFADKPTIAAVDGDALGGGVGIAAACDLVLATPRSSFALPELLFGLLPAIVLPVVLERMPAQKTRILALRAESMSADRALELGLADEVVTEDELPRAIRRFIRTLSRPDPGAVAALKRCAAGPDVVTGLDRGAGITATALVDPAVVGPIRDFLAGGTAPWLAR